MEIKDKDDRVGQKLNEKIKEWLLYVGFATAIISIIGYIAVTKVMIDGFTSDFDIRNQILFSLIGAGVGLVITFALRYQGVAFAKEEPATKEVMKVYFEALNRKKKIKDLHDINYYLVKKFIYDVVIKGIILVVTTILVIDVFSRGNGDKSLYWLMVFNILMFTGFGLMAIAGAYDHYIEQHIPVIVERTRKLNEKKDDMEYDKDNHRYVLTREECVKLGLPFDELDKDYSEGEVE